MEYAMEPDEEEDRVNWQWAGEQSLELERWWREDAAISRSRSLQYELQQMIRELNLQRH